MMNFVFKNNKEIMFVVLFLCSGLNASPQGVSSLFDDSTNLLGADSSFAFLQDEEPVEVEVSSLFDDPANLLGADGKTNLKPASASVYDKNLHTQNYSDLNPVAGSTYDPVKNNGVSNQEVLRLQREVNNLRAEVGNLRKQFETMILATKGLEVKKS